MTAPWLAILGINEDGALAPEAAALLARATLVLGGARHLALAAPLIVGEARPWPSPMAAALPGLLARRGSPTAVLASGDPLWFGVASLLLRHVPLAETRILPAPSCFALAAARLGWALQDTACLSCCGRPVAALVPHLHHGARLLVLCADATTPAAVAALLQAQGFGASVMHVLESLGGPEERIRTTSGDTASPPPSSTGSTRGSRARGDSEGRASAQAFPLAGDPRVKPVDDVPWLHDIDDIAPLNMLALELRGPARPLTPLPDDAFEHDGQLTKSEVRAVTLAALAPTRGALLWDVGAGSGSVGIEWMRLHPGNRAIAIEARPERAARIRRNAAALGVPGLQVIEGAVPRALAGLPPPDAVFLGGGAHRDGVIDAAWAALRPGGPLVANAIALQTEATLIAAQARLGGTLTRIGIERLDQVGGMAAYRPAMTVTQWKGIKP